MDNFETAFTKAEQSVLGQIERVKSILQPISESIKLNEYADVKNIDKIKKQQRSYTDELHNWEQDLRELRQAKEDKEGTDV